MRFLSYISIMVKNLDQEGLKSIVNRYDLFFIDLWGVVHNGIELYENSINVLDNLAVAKKDFVLLTNAPRPNATVINFLKKMGLKKYFKNVFTSGEAAHKYLISHLGKKNFFHIGPPRDFDLFKNIEKNNVLNIEDADYFLCTGLFEDQENDLNYYKKLLSNHTSKKMICTNPDLIVDRGEEREYCAGSVAKSFEEIKGEVIYFGKPHPPVYNLSTNIINKKVLCIGDNLNTDIKGANIQNFDSLLITNGIHRKEILDTELMSVLKKYETRVDYIQNNLKW
jgi:HAD superfamily hydrolase (TIGR01459 family)